MNLEFMTCIQKDSGETPFVENRQKEELPWRMFVIAAIIYRGR